MVTGTPIDRPEVRLLLSDIKEQPYEDRLRLVLADWLEDTGRTGDMARADLLRAQIALMQLPAESPDRFELTSMTRRLLDQYSQEWLGPVARWVASRTAVRGLWSVVVRAGELRGRAMSALAGTEAWAWVEEVGLPDMAAGELATLKANPLLADLTGLCLDGADLRNGAAEALAGLPWLARLTRIDLSQRPSAREPRIDSHALRLLLTSPYLDRLSEIRLGGASIGREGAEALAGSPRAAQFEKLVLWGNHLPQDALTLFPDAGTFPRLNYLDLRRNNVDSTGASYLARSPGATRLRHLNLADNQIDQAGAHALADSPHLEGLKSLILWGNPVGPEGALALRARFGSRVHVSSAAG